MSRMITRSWYVPLHRPCVLVVPPFINDNWSRVWEYWDGVLPCAWAQPMSCSRHQGRHAYIRDVPRHSVAKGGTPSPSRDCHSRWRLHPCRKPWLGQWTKGRGGLASQQQGPVLLCFCSPVLCFGIKYHTIAASCPPLQMLNEALVESPLVASWTIQPYNRRLLNLGKKTSWATILTTAACLWEAVPESASRIQR